MSQDLNKAELTLSNNEYSQIQLVNAQAKHLKAAKKTGVNLVAEYWKPQKGEIIRGFYVGDTSITVFDQKTNEPSELVCAKLVVFDEKENSQIYLAGQSQLRSALKMIDGVTPLEISCIGEKDLGGGKKMDLFRVELLELSK